MFVCVYARMCVCECVSVCVCVYVYSGKKDVSVQRNKLIYILEIFPKIMTREYTHFFDFLLE